MIFVTRLLYTNNDNMEHLNKNQNKEYGHYVWKHGKGPQTMTFCSVLECKKKKNLNFNEMLILWATILVTSVFCLLWQFSDITLFWDF